MYSGQELFTNKFLTNCGFSDKIPNMDNGLLLKNRVKELRSRLNMRQSDLAREVDVTRQTILAIEKGRLNPSIMVSLKIARVLREPVGYVFYLDRTSEESVVEGISVADHGIGMQSTPLELY